MSGEILTAFDLTRYLSDPTKLRGPEGEVPTFSSYSPGADNFYIEWPLGAKLRGVLVSPRDPTGKDQPPVGGITQDELRTELRLVGLVPQVSYGVALKGGGSYGRYWVVVVDSQDSANEMQNTDTFVRWLVPLITVDVLVKP